MGTGGARVRCPNCTRTFVVPASEAGVAEGAAHEASSLAGEQRDESVMSETSAAATESVQDRDPGSPESAQPAAAPLVPEEAPAHEAQSGPEDQAAKMLDALSERHGPALAEAAREGRMFATYGPELIELFERWRREVGSDTDPSIFRAVLRARWGVELRPGD